MASQTPESSGPRDPGPGAGSESRACQFCKARKASWLLRIGLKIKCDRARPVCSSCTTHGRQCVYSTEKRRPRPSLAIVSALRKEKQEFEDVLLQLKARPPGQANALLQELSVVDGSIKLPGHVEASGEDVQDLDSSTIVAETSPGAPKAPSTAVRAHRPTASRHNEVAETREGVDNDNNENEDDSDEETDGFDPTNHVSVDDQGRMGVFGLTSTHYDHGQSKVAVQERATKEEAMYQLVARAALERQKEFRIHQLPDVDGVPVGIAMHLLDLHWNRQHHTFLLTYRPAMMRDLVQGGPYCSKLLLNAVFACASKYSDRIEVRDDPADPLSCGRRFFRRCDELMALESPFSRPSIPTVVAFLLLGSTFIARGETSKGWMYSGFAMRMVYELGLHIDCRKPKASLEDVEIRRRVFWGAFICDKIQSLYLGRPIAMQLADSHCPAEFMDTLEELDIWTPYVDPDSPHTTGIAYEPTPVYSVSTFQQFCGLSKLMTRIVNCFYSSNPPVSKAARYLRTLDTDLFRWHTELPSQLAFEPTPRGVDRCVPPNIMNIHNTFHSLVILLHRPFVSDGHLRAAAPTAAGTSWKKCTVAARNITFIVTAYRAAYSLRGAPYLTSYAAYVACTIHVRNAALEKDDPNGEHLTMLTATLDALDALSIPNPGVVRPATIIRGLRKKYGITEQQPSPTAYTNLLLNADVSPDPMTMAPLFDTFAPYDPMQERLGELFAGENAMLDETQLMNDSLFGFVDNMDFQSPNAWTADFKE